MAKSIDILLGADVFANLLLGSSISGQSAEPIAVPTKLGYILSGPVPYSAKLATTTVCHSVDVMEFFNLESVPHAKKFIKSDAG